MTSYFPDEVRDTQPPRLVSGSGQSDKHSTRRSVWLPLLFKGLALTCGAVVLAGIGAVSGRLEPMSRHGSSRQEAGLVHLGGSEWLAGAEASPASSASASTTASASIAVGERLASDPEPVASAASHAQPPKDPAAPAGPGVTAEGKIILNLADAATLRRLPGIGQRRAEAIVALRTELRGFRKLSDLLRVKGIGPKGLRRMLPLLVLNPEPIAPPVASAGPS
jgi:competence protein ComEA